MVISHTLIIIIIIIPFEEIKAYWNQLTKKGTILKRQIQVGNLLLKKTKF